MPQARVSGGARPTTTRRATAAAEGEVARQWLCGIDDDRRSSGRGSRSAQGLAKEAKGETKRLRASNKRVGQSDGRCEPGHRRAGLAARPLIGAAGAFSWAMAIRHSATPASGRAMRCGNGLEVRGCGTWMQMPATRWCLTIGTSTSSGLRAGAHVLLAQAIHEPLPRLVWGLGEADAVDSVLCRGLVCSGSPLWGPALFVWRSAVFAAPSAAVKVSRALAPGFLGAWRPELWRFRLSSVHVVCLYLA
ncbi:hypothetical protein HDV63DRAFT_21715 [Trichoderma sp. SZMC 28014]